MAIMHRYFQMVLVMNINLPALMEDAYQGLGNVMGMMTVEVATSLMKKDVLVRK